MTWIAYDSGELKDLLIISLFSIGFPLFTVIRLIMKRLAKRKLEKILGRPFEYVKDTEEAVGLKLQYSGEWTKINNLFKILIRKPKKKTNW